MAVLLAYIKMMAISGNGPAANIVAKVDLVGTAFVEKDVEGGGKRMAITLCIQCSNYFTKWMVPARNGK
jgi:hypothetical protein